MTAPAKPMDRGRFLRRCEQVIEVYEAYLTGRTIKWGSGARVNAQRLLRDMGVELVSRSGAEKRGHQLLRGVTPVANAYYDAPLQLRADLYIFGVQTKPAPARRSKPAPGQAALDLVTDGR